MPETNKQKKPSNSSIMKCRCTRLKRLNDVTFATPLCRWHCIGHKQNFTATDGQSPIMSSEARWPYAAQPSLVWQCNTCKVVFWAWVSSQTRIWCFRYMLSLLAPNHAFSAPMESQYFISSSHSVTQMAMSQWETQCFFSVVFLSCSKLLLICKSTVNIN